MKRRNALKAVGGTVTVAGLGGLGPLFSRGVRADAATGDLAITGPDTINTDDGTIESLTVYLSDGHVSYDGLNTDAEQFWVFLLAKQSTTQEFDFTTQGIASASYDIPTQTYGISGMELTNVSADTRAGHADILMDEAGVSLFNSDDLSPSVFSDTSEDGTPEETEVDLRLMIFVEDSDGNEIVRGSTDTSVVVKVNDEASTADTEGTGTVSGSGSDQEP